MEFNWSTQCQESFLKAKKLLCSSPILAIFNPLAPVYIFTDASVEGVGATLKQPQEDNSLKPVFLFLKKAYKISKTEKGNIS